MTKEEKITDAYGEYWESKKKYVDENGFYVAYHKNVEIVLKKDLSVDFMIYYITGMDLKALEKTNKDA